MQENMVQKFIITSDFVYTSNSLTLPSIIYIGKRNSGFKSLVTVFQ